ncbi:hypothetical protein EYF80_032773 [Liparis tanakae]|uniref:Uncharacterized protein n=1 Tax=Liparis tanakae TaxID=230148 RepID=A0A4Z2GW19_9TELE|nr:hypothetical protein EYF80_032773 [Liparis tanakae]
MEEQLAVALEESLCDSTDFLTPGVTSARRTSRHVLFLAHVHDSVHRIPEGQSIWGPQRRQMRLFPSSISSCTLSLDVAISACAEKTAHRKVSTVPPMAV